MLDQITDLIKNQATTYLQGDDNVTADQVEGVAGVAQESVIDGLKGELLSGNVSGLTGLFSGGGESGLMDNPIVKGIISNFGGSLVSKLGFGESGANSLASGLIPNLMSGLSSKFQSESEEDAGFDLSAITSLMGGNEGAGGMLGNLAKGVVQNKLGDIAGGLFK